GRLRVQRGGQLAVARLELGEEADVLDGDDRLVGKGLEQPDLTVGERSHLCPGDEDPADGTAFAQQRYRERTSPPEGVSKIQMPILGIALDIGNMSDRAVQDGPTYRQTSARTH